jgi:hypothetical protein
LIFLWQVRRANGWAELEAFYAQLPVDQRHVIVRGVANEIRDKACFDAWISLSNSSIARTFKGAQYVSLAWYARGSAYADRVPKSAYKEFFGCLETAWESVRAAYEADPTNVEALTWGIQALLGLGAEKSEIYSCFEKIEEAGILHLDACNRMIQALAAKWHGSHEEMFAFARTQSNRDRGYSSALVLAHVERCFATWGDPDETTFDDYFKRVEVREEIRDTYRADSILETQSYFGLMAKSAYAFAFYKSGDNDIAAKLLQQIDRKITQRPWDYDGLRYQALNRARTAASLPELSAE